MPWESSKKSDKNTYFSINKILCQEILWFFFIYNEDKSISFI